MAGRPPKPTKLKILNGNPGRRPLPKNEFQPAQTGEPRVPHGLSKTARAEYRRLLNQYRGTGLLTHLDRAGLAMLCEEYAIWVHAVRMAHAIGPVVETTNGNLIQNPWLGIANRAQAEYRRWCTEFGLTPVARVRLSMPEQKGEDDFTQFLQRGKAVSGDGE